MKSRPVSISSVNGLAEATACSQPASSSSGTYTGARNRIRKTGICIAGPGLDGPRPHRHARREQAGRQRDEVGERDEREQVDAAAADPHPGRQRDHEQQRADERRPGEARRARSRR